ncbi:FAD-dependent oxidoreductase [Hydrotalea sp.]|uniref:FAD-dependent oxidoreductase n=1 Tax=Hydrotalea sp. TaxID=2881279 RepID=UPI00258565B4|nr:FAD-dependent oxidoreductase [Hydrotalea sp.]
MEMGATWFGPQHQYLQQLMQELKIDRFHQWQGGYAMIEAQGEIGLYALPQQADPYFRIAGGSSALIRTLADAIGSHHIHTATTIQSISDKGDGLELTATNGTLNQTAGIILAIQPQLAAQTMVFELQLPAGLLQVIHHTQTWVLSLPLNMNNLFGSKTNLSVPYLATKVLPPKSMIIPMQPNNFCTERFFIAHVALTIIETGKAMVTRQLVQHFGE